MFKYKVENLFIYPVKGFGGIEVQSQKALQSGFEWDRRWMLVDKNGNFVTQRTIPKMALIKCKLEKENLILNFKGKQMKVLRNQEKGESVEVKVWSHYVNAILVDKTVSKWLSEILKIETRLVKMNAESVRNKSLIVSPRKTPLSFADGYPYLICGTESLNFLNKKLAQKVAMDRFRPNIVVNTKNAHEEDTWRDFTIGENKLRMVKPCTRCNVVSVNQQSGTQSKEPTATLATYRKTKNSIHFGMNAICLENEAIINVRDEIGFQHLK